jgi:hypothetical protein
MQLIVLLSQVVYWGKIFFPSVSMFPPVSMFFPLAMLYGIYFTFLPDSFLDMSLRRNNIIFSPLVQFFLLVKEKLVKKLMGERKFVFFPFPYFSP